MVRNEEMFRKVRNGGRDVGMAMSMRRKVEDSALLKLNKQSTLEKKCASFFKKEEEEEEESRAVY